MLLTGPEIQRLAEGGIGPNGERIVITPFDPKCVGPNSYDVHLGDTIKCYKDNVVTPGQHNPTIELDFVSQGITLYPGELYLASTKEYTETHGLAPKLEGRSSIARCGMMVHLTAGFGDDGFCGHWTLEIVVAKLVVVHAGMRVAQICYQTLYGERKPYQGRYQHQPAQPVESRFHYRC